MAATKRNPMHIQKTRDAARATQLMNRLTQHGLSKVELSATQVRAIEIVLRKIIPDLSSVAVGQDDKLGPVQIGWKTEN